MPMSLRERIARSGAEGALDRRTSGLIGYVVNYHRPNDTCDCNRHKGATIDKSSWHTVDVQVNQGNRVKEYHDVPCFVYSQGIIDRGLKENDRVWIQFINGDPSLPIVTAYYREPSYETNIFRKLYYAVSDFFDDFGG